MCGLKICGCGTCNDLGFSKLIEILKVPIQIWSMNGFFFFGQNQWGFSLKLFFPINEIVIYSNQVFLSDLRKSKKNSNEGLEIKGVRIWKSSPEIYGESQQSSSITSFFLFNSYLISYKNLKNSHYSFR